MFGSGDGTVSVTQSTENPIAGSASLRVAIQGYGDAAWWSYPFTGRATSFDVSARVRSNVASTSDIDFCAFIYYADGTTDSLCDTTPATVGDKGVRHVNIPLSDKNLDSVRLRIVQVGGQAIQLSLDEAQAFMLGVVGPLPNPTPTSTVNPSPSGTPTSTPSTTPGTPYPGYTYTLPTARPYISLDPYANAPLTSAPYLRLKAQVDDVVTVTNNQAANVTYDQLKTAISINHYGYSVVDAVVMYRLSGEVKYIQQAIRMMDLFIQSENAMITANQRPTISGDSYLEVGPIMEEIALTYDYGYGLLSAAQRAAWEAYADQAIYNIWNYNNARWGNNAFPWSGWSVNDPGNNYHFSFLKATQLWALATQNMTWITFLQQQKYSALVPYYSQLTGGGSREGTGYGTAHKALFEDYRYWKFSTGEDLSALTPHARDTIDYWIHATVPMMTHYVPIGDQARSSNPFMFDYQRGLMIEAVALNQGTAQAARGQWWLTHAPVSDGGSGWQYGKMRYNFNFRFDLLTASGAEQAPTATLYDAVGTGVTFARSDWTTQASYIATIAGIYDQSHAHQDQGSFTFYKGTWLAVTPNIFSHGGINQSTDVHNIVRFQNGASIIPQNNSTSTKTVTDVNGTVQVDMNLSPAYSSHVSSVSSYTRSLTYERATHSLTVHDVCTVGAGVTPVWQLHTAAQPVVQANGTIVAGNLRVTPIAPAAPNVVIRSMSSIDAAEYSGGYRIELTAASGCEFMVLLQAQ